MSFENIFVTVGTTQFNELIDCMNTKEIVKILHEIGCKKLTIQIGKGHQPEIVPEFHGIKTEIYRLKPSIAKDIETANLVISHAGAGSCIECLNAGKPLIVVINERLMDNHQFELAQQLADDGYLLFCIPKNLAKTLQNQNINNLRPYEKGSVKEFIKELDRLMGFV